MTIGDDQRTDRLKNLSHADLIEWAAEAIAPMRVLADAHPPQHGECCCSQCMAASKARDLLERVGG